MMGWRRSSCPDEEGHVKGFELGRRMREAADALRARVAEKARELRRRARTKAGRVFHEMGERLRPEERRAGIQVAPCPHLGEGLNTERNIVVGPRTAAFVEIMTEVLTRSGYRELRARPPGPALS